jgi:hypothetical protein
MKHLRTACVVLAFVATTVSGSAQTSLTPGQDTTSSRTIIPQPAPVMRERIVNPSAGSDVGPDAAQQSPAQNNVFGPGRPSGTDRCGFHSGGRVKRFTYKNDYRDA